VITGRAWIQDLPPELAVQKRLLTGLLDAIESVGEWEWLEVGCSVAEGRADALSDLDLALGYQGDDQPAVEAVTTLLRSLGDVVDVAEQPWENYHRWWVQYADGGQIDLVVLPADVRPGRPPGSVPLVDRKGRLRKTFTPSIWSTDQEQPRRWLLDGWEALANTNKYLRRDSLLEANEQLARARQRIFQLWAVGEGVKYPVFGLTSLLDVAEAKLPPSIEATYPTLGQEQVHAAALSAATLLHAAGQHAEPGLDSPLREWVVAQLVHAR
jgi:hypothetical protein